jgi:probable F420-dependent oxidoreductase
MHFGLFTFPTDEMPFPAELARVAEERGYESLFLTDHTHIPASRESPHPGGIELPREYARIFDPFVALTSAAAATRTLKLGTGICLVTERDPIVTAKSIASLDVISGGRVLFGVGPGWNREEMRNHGTDPRTRMRLMGERVRAMKTIWTEDEASFHGEFVNFDRIWCWPKPAQRPHPPVIVGGNGPTVFDRVLAYGDAWMPNVTPDDDWLVDSIARLRERAGREVPVSLYGPPTNPARLERYREAGVERCIFYLPTKGWAELEKRLDQIEAGIAQLG